MSIISFLKSCGRLLRLAMKPGRTELWLSIKICAVGIIAVGMVGFVIKILSGLISGGLFTGG